MRNAITIAGAIIGWVAMFFAFGMCITVLFVTLVRAQPAPPASEQALGQKLLSEIQAGLQCSAQTIQLQAELTKLRAELAELKKPKE